MQVKSTFYAGLFFGLASLNHSVIASTIQTNQEHINKTALQLELGSELGSASVVQKSPLDKKSYRPLKLDNGLQVLLISDPEAERSAAALDVKVGSGHDPKDRQGMAHYLEHMLFLGTEKYPDTGAYQKYISDHGGAKNAYTVISDTNYHFSIEPDFLFPALDQFAQFFISPTFTEKYVQRERAIVNSEYMARRKDESRRLWTAQHVANNPAHPSTQFSVGSLETLADREQQPIRADLIQFYQRYYYGANMALTVLGREPLDELATQVSQIFSAIKDTGTSSPRFNAPLFLPDTLPLRLDLKPLIETRRVTFGFPIDSTRAHYQSKPLNYISSILGHEGKGSILAILKQQGWAEGLSAGVGYMDDVQGMMDISIKLTPEGLKHIEEIGHYLFSMIGHIARDGIEEWRFTEAQQLAELDFRFEEEIDPYGLVRSLASRLQRFSAEEVLSAPYLLQRWQPELVQQFLSQLSPDRMLLSVVDPTVSSTQKTDWYEVEYLQSTLDAGWLKKWNAALKGDLGPLALPEANPFVPSRLDMIELEESAQNKPEQLKSSSTISAWHQSVTEFNLPKANFFFTIRSPKASNSPKNAMMTQLMVKAINDRLSSYSYPALQAGLYYRLYRHSRGMSARISGYSDKQAELLSRILTELKPTPLSKIKFDQFKRELARDLANRRKGRPSDLAIGALYDVLLTSSWSSDEQSAVVEAISREDFNAHQQAFFQANSVMALSVGNISKETSSVLAKQVAQALLGAKVVTVERAQLRQLSQGQSLASSLSLEHPDSAFTLYFQGEEKSIQDLASMQILGALIEPSFYKQLRTENEVGYLVYATTFNVLDVPALLMSVQSNSHSVKDIARLSNAFIQGFEKELTSMSEEAYQTTRQGLLSQLREAPSNLGELADRYWSELDRSAYGFDTLDQRIAAIEGIDKQAILAFYSKLTEAKTSRRLLTLSHGKLDNERPDEPGMQFKYSQDLNAARADIKGLFPDAVQP